MKTLLICAALLLPSAAFAERDEASGFNGGPIATSESVSGAQSYSGVNVEASESLNNTPSMGAPSAIPTADCMNAASFAASGPGFGIALGGGNGNKKCNTRVEASVLNALVGKRAALHHICKHDAEMRATLVEMGLCRISR